jgi:hypothetical protein
MHQIVVIPIVVNVLLKRGDGHTFLYHNVLAVCSDAGLLVREGTTAL